MAKVDTTEKSPEKEKLEIGIKRKSIDSSESTIKQPKKIILNRNVSTVDKSINKTEGKENQEKTIPESSSEKKNLVKVGALSPQEVFRLKFIFIFNIEFLLEIRILKNYFRGWKEELQNLE